MEENVVSKRILMQFSKKTDSHHDKKRERVRMKIIYIPLIIFKDYIMDNIYK